MYLVVALDNSGGIMFNRRRQSKDRVLRQDLLQTVGNSRLWMNAYSAKQFEQPLDSRIVVSETFLEEAGPNEYCFLEGDFHQSLINHVEGIIVYWWNRSYPKDVSFSVALDSWTLIEATEFPGYSHERITKEVYKK